MAKRHRPLLLPLALLPLIAAGHAGGWATVSVLDLPDYVVAGQPVDLTFTVRQHGRTPLDRLQPVIEARAGSQHATAKATATRESGRYTATVTLPNPGDWAITINHGFGNGGVTLMPVKAIAAGTPAPAALSNVERGQRLFVAKACMSCHLHKSVKGSGMVEVGPELTERRFTSDYLTQFLTNPGILQSASRGKEEMPNPDLKAGEIVALIAFINNGQRQASR